MKLVEALDELRTNLLRDNAELASGPDDRLWSNKTLIRYVREAQRTWCRRTLTLRDSQTPAVCEVALIPDVTEYTLHKSVRAVISARYEDHTYDLWRVGHPLLASTTSVDDRPFDVNCAPTGAPIGFTTDESFDLPREAAVILRVFGTPGDEQDGKVLYLRVARMPLVEPLASAPNAELECPDEYCLGMLKYAAYLAMETSDIDGHDVQAEKHKDSFDAAVREVLAANRRKLGQPMRFGFGTSGTAWSR